MASGCTSPLGSHALVCTIHLGYKYSGCAFSSVSMADKIYMCTNKGNVVAVPHAQTTPTVVLMKNEGCKYLAFGHGALHGYSELDEEEVDDYSIYQNFTICPHTVNNIGREKYVPAKQGVSTSAMGLFSYCLKYLAEHLMETIENQSGILVAKDVIRWVITVPAIWSDAAKHFMREAAFQAELIPTKDSHSLVIALEPEAASLYCRQLDINHLLCTRDSKMGVGAKYMLLNCGDGTLDVTVHQLMERNKIAELYKSTVADLDDTKVDENFVKLLEVILGENVITSFQRTCALDFHSMMSRFEQRKWIIDPAKKQNLNIPLTASLNGIYHDMTGKRLKNAISPEWKDKGVAFGNGCLRIPHDIILGVFAPVVDKIVNHVRKLLQMEHFKAVSRIWVVGLFADSLCLQYELKREFGAIKQIIIPPVASSCVLKGATMFGHDPSSIVTHKYAKFTKTFGTYAHDPNKTNMYGGNCRVQCPIRTWIKKGEAIQMGKIVTFCHFPGTPDQRTICIELVCTELDDPVYCSDPGVDRLGSITFQLPGEGLDRRVEVKLILGMAKISFEGRECRPGGASAKINLNY